MTQPNERLDALVRSGTSPWLDQISREMIESGQLEGMIDALCLRGVTTNPSIFEKAILGSHDYDQELSEGLAEGLDPVAISHRIARRDVQAAMQVLRPVWESSGGTDGYVSLEVDPWLAHDADATLAQAREHREAVEGPNLMIKIPGTPEGLAAIEEATYEGINVNTTLLFAVQAYAEVIEAWLRGMERRLDEDKPLGMHAVASFFVSRVDTEVDKRLEESGRTDLAGSAGLANARAAYKLFLDVFRGERFARLREAGVAPQRPLWASTGVKNPAYPDTMYVDGLIGADTVNTMPLPTLEAFADHGIVAAPTAEIDPTPALDALREAGIDMENVTDKLLRVGVELFVEAAKRLLAAIEERMQAVQAA
jgi:transaldolase